jgi:hypothetical protein
MKPPAAAAAAVSLLVMMGVLSHLQRKSVTLMSPLVDLTGSC